MQLDPDRVYEAIAEGVERAIWRMITSGTQMPSADFYATIGEAARQAFGSARDKGDRPRGRP